LSSNTTTRKKEDALSETFTDKLRSIGAKQAAQDLNVTPNYIYKVLSKARPITDHLLAHAWRVYGRSLDLEGSIRQRNPKLREDRIDAEIALIVMLAHRYAVEEGSINQSALSITLERVVRDMMGVDSVAR